MLHISDEPDNELPSHFDGDPEEDNVRAQEGPSNPVQDDHTQDDCAQEDPSHPIQDGHMQDDPAQVEDSHEDPAQEDPEQLEQDEVTGAISTGDALTSGTPHAALTPDLLAECGDWPEWFTDGIKYLQTISKEESWVTLITSVIKLETSLGFTGAVSRCNLVNLSNAD